MPVCDSKIITRKAADKGFETDVKNLVAYFSCART